ncbi:anillin-like isoform X2 [Toxorhynchites rutilus septentrionalis]|uniref:anillin-like isoform X2 n=1 Tax=Toxorhynchites rutilus septentrionalis TaxID=329112 RepID=UPI0024783BC4|nr:anillin-like isoform X2 [Toxorhynchites rutilus septentrionalis]
MDPFTQNILDRAEKRAAALGITSTSKFPLSEYNCDNTAGTASANPKSPGKKSATTYSKTPKKNTNTAVNVGRSPSRVTSSSGSTKIETQRKQSSESGKDVDVAVEINITTGTNVQVEVEVAECEMDSTGKITRKVETRTEDADAKSLIRDSSRNQLQRLGTLYSESQDLSSPVHRTEGKFHEENATDKENNRPRPKLAKLAMLADCINNWEDDTSHPNIKHHRETVVAKREKSPAKEQTVKEKKESPKKSGAMSKKYVAPNPPKSILSPGKTDSEKAPTKTLKWDKQVMDALESQGFQRRESTTSKLVYDYKSDTRQSHEKQEIEANEKALVPLKKTRAPEIPGSSRERGVVQKTEKAIVKKPEVSKGLVSTRAAIFESSKKRQSIARNQKDPAEMSLKERLAMFEKNKGQALVPKAAFGISPSIRQITGESTSATGKQPSSCLAIQGAGIGTISKDQTVKQKQKIDSYNKPQLTESSATGSAIKNALASLMANNSTISESRIAEETRRQRQQEMEMLLNRFSKPADMSSDAIDEKSIPMAPPMPPEGYLTLSAKKQQARHDEAVVAGNKRRSGEKHISPEVRSTLEDVKRIRVVPPKDGHLYPTLSDIETTTTESEEGDEYTTATVSGEEGDQNQTHYRDCYDEEEQEYEEEAEDEEHPVDEDEDSYMYSDEEEADSSANISDVSLGREIMQAVKLQDRRVSHGGRRRESHERKRKSSVSSNSFSYKKNPRHSQYQTIDEEDAEEKKDPQKPSPKQQQEQIVKEDYSSPVKSELKINPSDDNNMVTLVHTVSFYRRQQNTNTQTPVKKIMRTPVHSQPQVDSTTEDSDDGCSATTIASDATIDENEYLVQEKVKKLLDEVCKQQTVIAQASQALNLCAATIEFSGSTESVEGERHLLVATHRRQAILDEVQRLRVEGCIRPRGAPTEKGRLTVKEITLPLKQDYIRKLSSDSISGHHVVCLLKYNETILATQTIPTLPGLLSVRFPDVLQLNNVFADFKITMEIYGMTAQREILPHEIKYHIAMNKKGSNKLHTPKGVKSNSRLIMPPVQSPAGPQAVRTPALVQYGFIIFSLKEIQRTNWTLNPVSGVSPLEGTVHMKVNCELTVTVDYRGFLTMFEDVSGFGAWHRRWCRLQGHVLNYWKYPDDEKRKAPIGSIDLQGCCTQKVSVAPRDVCARLNTLLLEFRRPAQPGDVESLVLVKQGSTTLQRHLLSADSKEEREEWCAHLNKTLALLKAWGQPNNRNTPC